MLTTADLAEAITDMHERIAWLRDDLNAADRQLGDGDTGMTIAQLVGAWHHALPELPAVAGAALTVLGRATRRASGSSLGAVLAIGLTAAGKHAGSAEALDRAGIAGAVEQAAAAISERSGASAGDKTILDSLLRIGHALATANDGDALLDIAVSAAAAAVESFRGCESRLGRARIYGAKSIGHDDPGMLAALRLLEAARGRSPSGGNA
jgi:dihydroxyacetone kinase-like protein